MSTSVTLDVRGIAETYGKLVETSMIASQRDEVREGLRRGGDIIAELAKRGIRNRSGNLVPSIDVGNITVSRGKSSVRVLARRPEGSHGWLVENGHVGPRGVGRADPHPYLAPAMEEGRDEALKEIAAGVERAIRRTTK